MPLFSGARDRFLVQIARHVIVNEEHHIEVEAAWIDQQLATIHATRDELERVLAVLDEHPDAHDPGAERELRLETPELEDEVLAAIRRERNAAARTNDLLAQLASRGDADWEALAALVGIPVDALRTRAGRDPESAYSAPGYATISEAATMLGVARSTIHRKIQSGKTKTATVRGRQMIPLDEKGVPII